MAERDMNLRFLQLVPTLDTPWSSATFSTQITKDLMGVLKEKFNELDSLQKQRVLFSFFGLRKNLFRDVEADFKELCDLAKADDDEWVQVIGLALGTFGVDKGSVGLDLPSNASFSQTIETVRAKLADNPLHFYPLEYAYIDESLHLPQAGDTIAQHHHFSVKNPTPRAFSTPVAHAALRASQAGLLRTNRPSVGPTGAHTAPHFGDSSKDEKITEKLFVREQRQPRPSPVADRKPFLASLHTPGDFGRSSLTGSRSSTGGTLQRPQQKKTVMLVDFEEEKNLHQASKPAKKTAVAEEEKKISTEKKRKRPEEAADGTKSEETPTKRTKTGDTAAPGESPESKQFLSAENPILQQSTPSTKAKAKKEKPAPLATPKTPAAKPKFPTKSMPAAPPQMPAALSSRSHLAHRMHGMLVPGAAAAAPAPVNPLEGLTSPQLPNISAEPPKPALPAFPSLPSLPPLSTPVQLATSVQFNAPIQLSAPLMSASLISPLHMTSPLPLGQIPIAEPPSSAPVSGETKPKTGPEHLAAVLAQAKVTVQMEGLIRAFFCGSRDEIPLTPQEQLSRQKEIVIGQTPVLDSETGFDITRLVLKFPPKPSEDISEDYEIRKIRKKIGGTSD